MIALAIVALSLWHSPARYANIYHDGILVESLDLLSVSDPYSVAVESGAGSNMISIEPGRIRVSEASCPDGYCIRQGWVSGGVIPIVCLPHRLVVSFENTEAPQIDAVVG